VPSVPCLDRGSERLRLPVHHTGVPTTEAQQGRLDLIIDRECPVYVEARLPKEDSESTRIEAGVAKRTACPNLICERCVVQ
jgi:hypothetical protein